MKQCKHFLLPFIIFILLLIPAVIFSASMQSIQIKNGVLRSSPSFLGKVTAKVSYGDRVEGMENKNGWSKVRPEDAEISGWIHDSALTHKKIILMPGQTDVAQAATSDEIALAGKGFNEQVEREMKDKYPQMDYSSIDKMEKIVVSDPQMKQFLNEGRVLPPEGAE
jgi:hypothetical protein